MKHNPCFDVETDDFILENVGKIFWQLFGVDHLHVSISRLNNPTQNLQLRTFSLDGHNVDWHIFLFGPDSNFIIELELSLIRSFHRTNTNVGQPISTKHNHWSFTSLACNLNSRNKSRTKCSLSFCLGFTEFIEKNFTILSKRSCQLESA